MEISYRKSHLSSVFWLHARLIRPAKPRHDSLSFDLNKSLITGDELQFQVVSDRCNEASIFKVEKQMIQNAHTL